MYRDGVALTMMDFIDLLGSLGRDFFPKHLVFFCFASWLTLYTVYVLCFTFFRSY